MAERLLPRIWLLLCPGFFVTRRAWCQHDRLLSVGQFGWSEDGSGYRFARRREVRRRRVPNRQPLSWHTQRIRTTRPPSRRRLLSWVSRTGLPRRPAWKRESKRCANPVPRSSIASTGISVMASGSAKAPAPRVGCSKPFGSGKSNPMQNGDSARVIWKFRPSGSAAWG